MAKAKIIYDYNNRTGKRVIHIEYQSDPDALAYEHEKEHARLVRELVSKGLASKDDEIVIDRPEQKKKENHEVLPPQAKRVEKVNE